MYMMDSNQITPEMVSKFINGLYIDTYPGFIKEFRVEVINYKKNTNFYELVDPKIFHKIGLVFIKDNSPSPLKDNFIKFSKSFDK